MSFDTTKAQLTPAQLEVAETADMIYELIRGELEDEDPGEIDWDDLATIALSSPMLIPRIQALITAIGQSGGGLNIGILLTGAGAAFLNDNADELVPMPEAPQPE